MANDRERFNRHYKSAISGGKLKASCPECSCKSMSIEWMGTPWVVQKTCTRCGARFYVDFKNDLMSKES